jgi:hypothetical protein|uniref:Uncharacterized protein n=1 Tax=Attheya septentrionalis TaxID=420275 RepID=A0A7S2XN03_9STRA|mmetsp:Transcript_21983/g.39653  ORF Transcript_21983/g.39653 Transcript_21983/m.39653 type:complete len:199 (+) Transcript_21983:171-767(+)
MDKAVLCTAMVVGSVIGWKRERPLHPEGRPDERRNTNAYEQSSCLNLCADDSACVVCVDDCCSCFHYYTGWHDVPPKRRIILYTILFAVGLLGSYLSLARLLGELETSVALSINTMVGLLTGLGLFGILGVTYSSCRRGPPTDGYDTLTFEHPQAWHEEALLDPEEARTEELAANWHEALEAKDQDQQYTSPAWHEGI